MPSSGGAPDPAATSPVEAVDRGLVVLQALAQAGPRGLALADLAAEIGLSKATLHRVLAALRFRDFVVQDPLTRSYALGAEALGLARTFLREDNLPALLHAPLVALCREVDELVHLGVLSGARVTYLEKVEPERAVRVWSAIGRRSPAVTTALGRVLLAYRGTDRQTLETYVRAVADERVVDPDHVWSTIERARSVGYATEAGENEAGISCVAVPLLRSGTAVAAISVTAPSERLPASRMGAVHDTIRSTVAALLPDDLALPGDPGGLAR